MIFIPIIASIVSLIFAYFLIQEVNKSSAGTGKMIEIAQAIKEGAVAFLKRQYRTIGIVAVILFFILFATLGIKSALGFLIGALASALSGFIGMMVSTKANVRVAEIAKLGLKRALNLSFKGGSVTGFLVVGLGLFSVSVFYLLTQDLKALIALGFGGSLISVFARLGGGIYTKAADVGADLVGKVEKGIPEDDPRNPAVIADQVGDNVGDCAGMAADLFETYVVTIIAAMVLGGLIFPNLPEAIFLPLILGSIGILASIISTFFVRLPKNQSVISALYKGLLGAGILSAIGFLPVILQVSKDFKMSPLSLYLPALIGLLIAAGMFLITEFFTSKKYSPVQSIAKASQSGHGTNIIAGLAVGMKSTILPVILISAGILISFSSGGLYGLALSALAMLSLSGLIIALDSYGPITDNAAGISEMAGLPEETRAITDALDSIGNTTKAVTKGYAIASAGLAALVLFSAFNQELSDYGAKVKFMLDDPRLLVGLFAGGVVAYYFVALAMESVGKAAGKVVEEVRRQFKEIPGLMAGLAKPDYSKCVDIVTKSALREMIVPALLPVVFPILIGKILGPEALGGLLIGSIIVGIFLAIQMTSGGAAWDNAKKYIEEGNLGGKGSFAHQSAVTGDTVGDPYKDTAGPAINPMIKILNIVALLIVSFLV
ncbi:MAG: sodium-translocating pyrophosphatase [Candidatus Nealsonbacteria bacterium CG_4_10_14_0_2_um_filter_40_15]|uniref:K(+)-insensitive pyrophosphate-energized proton pump n=2 Tax=Candidatus Nealsoniibacteriota TaxID=1817911 RepID=A0A2M7D786_9BACT|nr:MAG: sodium-translocating pyrophosphatase [Candidatus Nealsonbacteria bacterium CG02_land_8_20_14_3_00_40_11]PIZ86926.1 MAG: sodium-translocating pyrophosphatase [Candidatus Nealsonbacteria bacterium CG_4_10_14_0_2_um_filter_40_15]